MIDYEDTLKVVSDDQFYRQRVRHDLIGQKMLRYFVACILIINLTISDAQLCYRCFGSSWCNNFTDPTFISNVHIINCPATRTTFNFDGVNPLIARVLKNLEDASNRINDREVFDENTWGCVTATLHEGHEVHTVRTCLNNAAIICPTVRTVVLNPELNDIPSDTELDCEGCTDMLCNNHTFIEAQPETTTTTTSSTTTTTTTVAPTTSTTTSTEPSTPSSSVTSTQTSTTSSTTPSTTTSTEPSTPSSSIPSTQTSTTSSTTSSTTTSTAASPTTSSEASSTSSTSSTTTSTTTEGSPSPDSPETSEEPTEVTTPSSGYLVVLSYGALILAIVIDIIIM